MDVAETCDLTIGQWRAQRADLSDMAIPPGCPAVHPPWENSSAALNLMASTEESHGTSVTMWTRALNIMYHVLDAFEIRI
jgi:hypothetical protein